MNSEIGKKKKKKIKKRNSSPKETVSLPLTPSGRWLFERDRNVVQLIKPQRRIDAIRNNPYFADAGRPLFDSCDVYVLTTSRPRGTKRYLSKTLTMKTATCTASCA